MCIFNNYFRFGAGSEFGREARQEARKRRYGGNKKVSESNPWLLKVGGKKYSFFKLITNYKLIIVP